MAEFDENDPSLAKHFEYAGIEEDTTTTETTDVTQSETNVEATTTEAKGTEGTEPKTTSTDSTGSGTDGALQQGKEEKAEVVAGPGDLVLPDGSIVKAGPERRLHEQREVARQQANHYRQESERATQRVNELQSQLDAYEQATQSINGIGPEQAARAVRLYRDLTSDPVSTVKNLLAELKANGHNLEGIGGAVDTAAIRLMLDQQRNAVVEDSQDDREAAINLEVTQFFSRFPDAITQEDAIANVITRNPSWSFEQAYFILKEKSIEAGLDWSRPISQQIIQRQQVQVPQQVSVQQQQSHQPPMLNGRPAVSSVSVQRENVVSSEGETMDDIIRAAMRENGLTSR